MELQLTTADALQCERWSWPFAHVHCAPKRLHACMHVRRSMAQAMHIHIWTQACATKLCFMNKGLRRT